MITRSTTVGSNIECCSAETAVATISPTGSVTKQAAIQFNIASVLDFLPFTNHRLVTKKLMIIQSHDHS